MSGDSNLHLLLYVTTTSEAVSIQSGGAKGPTKLIILVQYFCLSVKAKNLTECLPQCRMLQSIQ